MSTTQTRPRPYRVLLTILAVILIYVLSVGPVLTTADRLGLAGTKVHRALRVVYAPVFVVARASNVGTRIYESYVGVWCRIILKKDYPKHSSPGVPVEGLLVSVGSITNGQSSFELFVPSELSFRGAPTTQNTGMALIIENVRQYGLFPAGFQEQSGGRLYTFQREREWERQQK